MDVICDYAHQDLDQVPALTMQMSNLKMLYLESNRLTSLPEDFFYRLPLLSWLDLRNNHLSALPVSIQFHSFLENLLLQNNRIAKLPNELGLVASMKVLQLTGNPLQYPTRDIIEKGIDDICAYLKDEYVKEHIGQTRNVYLKEIMVTPKLSSTISSTSSKSIRSEPSVEEIRKTVRKRFAKIRAAKYPVLTVKSLSKLHQEQLKKQEADNNLETHESSSTEISSEELDSFKSKSHRLNLKSPQKVHKIVSERSKLSVHSLFNSEKYVESTKNKYAKDSGAPALTKEHRLHEKRFQNQHLKDLWLTKLKDLLQDQEKIIQQERNLNILNDWRHEKRREPIRDYDPDKLAEGSVPPYDIDPEYSRIPSRSDLSKHLDKLVRRDRKKHPPRNVDVDVQRLINNLIKQLKEIETSTEHDEGTTHLTPRKKMERTEKEIRMIMDLHKKVSALQNEYNT